MTVIACTPQVITPGIVQFSAAEFLASYPEFTGINNGSAAALSNDFTAATFLLNNSCCSRVQDANQRQFLLYLLTAHIAAIAQGVNDAGVSNPVTSLVGSVSAASPGVLTVTAATGFPLAVGTVLYDGPSGFLPAGTSIASIVSGTGGIGVYTLNVPISVAIVSESIIVAGVPNVQPPLGVVGRISQAAEGDVSVSAEWAAPPTNPSQAYFVQTKYGAQFWAMTAQYRTAIFLPAPPAAYNPLAGYGLGPWGPGRGY